jgi:hypothetical protein
MDPSPTQPAVLLNEEEQWTHFFWIFVEIFDRSFKS